MSAQRHIHPVVLGEITAQMMTETRPHSRQAGVVITRYSCGCQINTHADETYEAWLCQYHQGFDDGYDRAVDDLT